MSGGFPEFDLLGDPWKELRDPRGRKRHRVTNENRWKVSSLRADGRTHAEIAEALGISDPTLREYYFRELRHGAAMLRSRAMLKLCELALVDGQTSALKLLFARLDAGDTLPKSRRIPAEPKSPAPKGKNEQLREDAVIGHQGTSWGAILPN